MFWVNHHGGQARHVRREEPLIQVLCQRNSGASVSSQGYEASGSETFAKSVFSAIAGLARGAHPLKSVRQDGWDNRLTHQMGNWSATQGWYPGYGERWS